MWQIYPPSIPLQCISHHWPCRDPVCVAVNVACAFVCLLAGTVTYDKYRKESGGACSYAPDMQTDVTKTSYL